MAEEMKKTKVEEKKDVKVEEKKDVKVEEKKVENKTETKVEEKKDVKVESPIRDDSGEPDKKVETKTEDKPEKKVTKKTEPIKREVAIANGFSMKISPKQCKYTCRVIRGKSPDAAIARLQAVIEEKRPVPMAALEIGHRKGKGLAGGRFPKNACKGIMEIIKQAAANAVVAGIENPVISIAKSDQAAAPYRKAGRRAKRAHIHIEIRDRVKMMEAKKK